MQARNLLRALETKGQSAIPEASPEFAQKEMTAPPPPASSNGLQFASLYALTSDARAKKAAKFDASSAVLGREREGERETERDRERERVCSTWAKRSPRGLSFQASSGRELTIYTKSRA